MAIPDFLKYRSPNVRRRYTCANTRAEFHIQLQVSNAAKDIVAPYKHMVPTFDDDRAGWEARTSLLFFQGQLQRKAVRLRKLLRIFPVRKIVVNTRKNHILVRR